MIIATAGHIDHGKTSLVRALTGADTDRLPAEKARGITIDIGFAYWTPEGGPTIGFVDVPGHEKFVRNMLAGAAAVDFGLLVVAADDGIMPQTMEHLEILDLLGLSRGAVAITKTDLVPDARIEALRGDIAQLLAGTGLEGAPMVPLSTVTGTGVAELAALLRAASAAQVPRRGSMFRYAVDRSFTVKGAGTVVTGTAVSGRFSAEDPLVLMPAGQALRVRDLQGAGLRVGAVTAGQRCAINIGGIEQSAVKRGDWLVAPELDAPTSRLAVTLRCLSSADRALKHNSLVQVHIGTASILARLLVPKRAAITPAEGAAMARLVLEAPTHAATGDRFVLRDRAGRVTLGGGAVVDPFAPEGRQRQDPAPFWEAMRRPDPRAALSALLALPEPVDCLRFERSFLLATEEAEALYAATGAELYGKPRRALPADRIAAATLEIAAAVAAHHETWPAAPGMPTALLNRILPRDALPLALRPLLDSGEILREGPVLRLPDHRAPAQSRSARRSWQHLLKTARDFGPTSFGIDQLARRMRMPDAAVAELVAAMRGSGEVFRISRSRYLLGPEMIRLGDVAVNLGRERPKGFGAGHFRDASGTGRNLVIEILELFDRIGLTSRRGNLRIARPDAAPFLDRAAQRELGLKPADYLPKKPSRRAARAKRPR